MRAVSTVAAALALLLAPALASASARPVPLAKSMAEKAALSPAGYAPPLTATAGNVAETEPNDTPGTANPVTAPTAVDCALSSGDSDWFLVTAGAGELLTLSTAGLLDSITDTFLRVFAADGHSPLAADDDGGAGLFSAVEHFVCPSEGTFYVEVRHFSPSGQGSYTLVVEPGSPAPPPPTNDICASAIEAQCGGLVTGSTVTALPDVDAELACTGYPLNGPDVFYRVEVPYSYQLRAQVSTLTSFDPALYVFQACGQQLTCLAGADLAFLDEDELVTWVNEVEGAAQVVYIGVDSWSPASRGDFRLSISCEFVVPNEATTWGTLKSTFAR